MGKFLLAAVAITLMIYSLFDLIATSRNDIRGLPKPLWFVVVLLVPVIGPLAWLLWGHRRVWRPPSGGRPAPRPPWRPKGPDDDPDYLRGL